MERRGLLMGVEGVAPSRVGVNRGKECCRHSACTERPRMTCRQPLVVGFGVTEPRRITAPAKEKVIVADWPFVPTNLSFMFGHSSRKLFFSVFGLRMSALKP